MNLVQTVIDGLKEVPISDIMKERLALARDEYDALERKRDELAEQVGELKADLRRAASEGESAKAELVPENWTENGSSIHNPKRRSQCRRNVASIAPI